MFLIKRTLPLLIIFLLSVGCSQKNPSSPQPECGERTMRDATSIGAVVGAVAGKLSQTNMLVGAVVGGVIGAISGNQLASMQCKYYGKEKALLEKIDINIQEQNSLADQTNNLNKKMSALYQEIKSTKEQEGLSDNRRMILLDKIKQKEQEILSVKRLNSNVINNTHHYYQSLKTSNFSKRDKGKIKNSLNRILSSLENIKNASSYNLEQLQKFKRRVE